MNEVNQGDALIAVGSYQKSFEAFTPGEQLRNAIEQGVMPDVSMAPAIFDNDGDDRIDPYSNIRTDWDAMSDQVDRDADEAKAKQIHDDMLASQRQSSSLPISESGGGAADAAE